MNGIRTVSSNRVELCQRSVFSDSISTYLTEVSVDGIQPVLLPVQAHIRGVDLAFKDAAEAPFPFTDFIDADTFSPCIAFFCGMRTWINSFLSAKEAEQADQGQEKDQQHTAR